MSWLERSGSYPLAIDRSSQMVGEQAGGNAIRWEFPDFDPESAGVRRGAVGKRFTMGTNLDPLPPSGRPPSGVIDRLRRTRSRSRLASESPNLYSSEPILSPRIRKRTRRFVVGIRNG